MKHSLFAFVFLFLGLVQVNADCTIDTAATGGDNIMTGAELLTYINSNNCTGTLTIEAPVDIILNSTITIPSTIDRIVIKNGGQILWSTNNVDLILAANSAIVIENTTDIGSTTGAIGSTSNSCSNTKAIMIGNVRYSACNGGGNVCVIFADLIQNGGTIQIDPNFAVISGSDNEVCFAPTNIAIELNGYMEGTPQFSWSKISGPGTVTFTPNNTAITTVTVSIPGSYTLRISVTVPLSDDCLDQFVTVYNDIEIEFREGLGATTMATTPGGGGTCNLNVDFTTSTTNGGSNLTYLWNFGDGNTSTAMNPSHTYAAGGIYNVSLTVTDPDGVSPCNVIVVNKEVIISDDAPTITAPNPATIEGCDISAAPASETTVAGLKAIGFIISDDTTGDSDLIVGSSDSVSGTCPIVITRTYTITDGCGNMSQANQIINILDTTNPIINTPAANSTVECDGAGNTAELNAWLAANGGAIASDTCGDIVWSNNFTSLSDLCDAAGVTTVTFRATDVCGNFSETTATFTIEDTTPPQIPENAGSTVQCIADAIQPAAPVVTDACSNDIVPVITQSTDPICEGNKVYTFTYTDCAGNISVYTYTYTIEVTSLPIVPANAGSTVECIADAIQPAAPVVTDACGNNITPVITENTDPICEGDKVYTFTYTDCAGNISIYTYTYTIEAASVIVIPANAGSTVECIADAVQPDAPVVTDACGNNIVPIITENADPACGGDKIYSFTYTDCAGNVSVYTYTYKIQDTIAPEAPNAPSDMTYECLDDVPAPGNLTAVDNCLGDITVAGVDTIDNSNPCMIIITRTWSFADTCNNVSTVTQTITVQDTKAPTVAPYDTVLNVSCTSIPSVPSLKFEDNCSSNVTVKFSETSTLNQNVFQDYQIIRTWEVADTCGNTDEFTQTINVTLDEIFTQLVAEDRCYKDGIIDLDTYISNTSGIWEMIQGNPNATLTNNIFDPTNLQLSPEFLPTTDGIEYIFRHTTIAGGCKNVTELSITIDAKCDVLPCGTEDIFISKAVTPNGDAYNETFDIVFDSNCGFKANVKIFNRWGALIYESSDYRIGKNMGGFAGRAQSSVGSASQVPNGTYYYIIVLENSGLKPFTGPLYIGTK